MKRKHKIIAGSALALAVASTALIRPPVHHGAPPAAKAKHDAPAANFARNIQVTVSAVPEPATWAMLILGLAMIGLAARRRTAAAPDSA